MAKVRGNAFRFYSDTNPGGAASYTALDCEGDVTLNYNRSAIDVTGKCDGGDSSFIKGISNWTVDGSGTYEPGDAGVDQIRDDILSATQTSLFQLKTFNSEIYSGTVLFTSFTINAANDNAVNFTFSAQGTGALSVA